jgi:hypothetical protein
MILNASHAFGRLQKASFKSVPARASQFALLVRSVVANWMKLSSVENTRDERGHEEHKVEELYKDYN